MSLFCRHEWAVLAVSYAPIRVTQAYGSFTQREQEMIQGVTTYTLRCEKCPKLRTIKHLGKAVQEPSPAWKPPGIKL